MMYVQYLNHEKCFLTSKIIHFRQIRIKVQRVLKLWETNANQIRNTIICLLESHIIIMVKNIFYAFILWHLNLKKDLKVLWFSSHILGKIYNTWFFELKGEFIQRSVDRRKEVIQKSTNCDKGERRKNQKLFAGLS